MEVIRVANGVRRCLPAGAVSLAVTLAGVAWTELERGPRAVEVDRPGAARVRAPGAASADPVVTIPGYSCYRTVEETYASAEAIVDTYPHLATWTRAGESWEKANDYGGYDMMVLRLTNAAVGGPKPALFVTSAIHGDEYAPAEFATRFAEHMVDVYGVDADATWLLDHHELHLLLQANPDARKQAEQGIYWRKNRNRNHCPGVIPTEWHEGTGVDLNRNFAFEWSRGGEPGPCGSWFRGSAPESEPETQAIAGYMRSLFPDRLGTADDAVAPLDTSGIHIDIHSWGEALYWFGHANEPRIRTLARKLGFFNRYPLRQVTGRGHAAAYADGELGRASVLFELGKVVFEPCAYFEQSILSRNVAALRYAFKAVRTPYVTPAGPDAVDVGVSAGASPPGVAAGTRVTLSAKLDDRRYRGAEPTQAVAAGEYYVDVPPWGDDASATAMTAADGAFDATAEDATASIDTTGWSAGRHVVFVRGKDADDNWGAVSAVFLFIRAGVAWRRFGRGNETAWRAAASAPSGRRRSSGNPVPASARCAISDESGRRFS